MPRRERGERHQRLERREAAIPHDPSPHYAGEPVHRHPLLLIVARERGHRAARAAIGSNGAPVGRADRTLALPSALSTKPAGTRHARGGDLHRLAGPHGLAGSARSLPITSRPASARLVWRRVEKRAAATPVAGRAEDHTTRIFEQRKSGRPAGERDGGGTAGRRRITGPFTPLRSGRLDGPTEPGWRVVEGASSGRGLGRSSMSLDGTARSNTLPAARSAWLALRCGRILVRVRPIASRASGSTASPARSGCGREERDRFITAIMCTRHIKQVIWPIRRYQRRVGSVFKRNRLDC